MADWGTGSWGVTDWGGAVGAVGTNAPRIVTRLPAPLTQDVPENAVITVKFFDIDYDLATQTAEVYVDDVLAFDGLLGVSAGFVGRSSYEAGALVVQVMPITGFVFGSTVTVRAYIEDTGGLIAQDTWTWTVRANTMCYTGLSPLQIELAIQQPMERFLDLEPLRLVLFNNALKTDAAKATANRDNKAARVIYQWAHETELSTVLNPHRLRNAVALKSVVCERENTAVADRVLTAMKSRVQSAVTSLYTLNALPQEYVTGFMDYVDSTVYSYRVSLAANMVLLARAVELQG